MGCLCNMNAHKPLHSNIKAATTWINFTGSYPYGKLLRILKECRYLLYLRTSASGFWRAVMLIIAANQSRNILTPFHS